MKKYYIGGSKRSMIFNSIFLVLVICFTLLFIIPIIDTYYDSNMTSMILSLLVVIPVMGIFYYLVFSKFQQYKRKLIALQGHKSTGVVEELRLFSNDEGTGTFRVKISYTTDSGEKVLLVTSIPRSKENYFVEGKEIPLYVNGNYGYFKEEEIFGSIESLAKVNDLEVVPSKKIEKKDTTCPYCGTTLKGNEKKCPSCKSNLL